MTYKRQIAYFDYIEDGQKKGSKGFCKWEQRNGGHVLVVSLSGLPGGITEKAGIYTKAGGVLGELNLRNGRAEAVYRLVADGHDWCRELDRIWIPLSQGRELAAEFPEGANTSNEEKTHEDPAALNVKGLETKERKIIKADPVDIKVLKLEPEPIKELEAVEEPQPIKELEAVEEPQPIIKVRSGTEPEVIIKARVSRELEVIGKPEPITEPDEIIKPEMIIKVGPGIDPEPFQSMQEEVPLLSLWDCLAVAHETMHPFGTEVEYYRIMMEDIYLLKERYHILRNNQFLLHGYYNYKYLILGKKDEESEEYWLGVPGIYHDREKMAARMYGFEKFEGAKPRYGIGDLGYYLITVK